MVRSAAPSAPARLADACHGPRAAPGLCGSHTCRLLPPERAYGRAPAGSQPPIPSLASSPFPSPCTVLRAHQAAGFAYTKDEMLQIYRDGHFRDAEFTDKCASQMGGRARTRSAERPAPRPCGQTPGAHAVAARAR